MSPNNTVATYTDIGGIPAHVVLDASTGQLHILRDNGTMYPGPTTVLQHEYLQGAAPSSYRFATVNGELFICNTERMPTAHGSFGTVSWSAGFAYITAGAFSRKYTLTLKTHLGEFTVDYTTPDGTGAGDAALAAPEYISEQLTIRINLLNHAGIQVSTTGTYMFIENAAGSLHLSSETGSAYMVTSRSGYVTQVGQLPARLTEAGHGFICAVGDIDMPQYYVYSYYEDTWRECAGRGSPTGLLHMPISVIVDEEGGFVINPATFEGRLAGDDKSNPLPEFIRSGITGMATHQGRLVLLAGSMVCMSASRNPRRFMRSTVTAVLDSDPIEVGSSMNTSAAYRHAVQFQKDLVLFSSAYQALVPSGNTAITPRNATVVPTSNHACDTTAPPVSIGRTLLFPSPKSTNYFGVMEMLPSPYTDSQYISTDSTAHIPKYLAGRCRFTASCSSGNIAVFGMTGDLYSMAIHEYAWDGDNKVQQAWHMWKFPYPVACAYFAGSKLCVVLVNGEAGVIAGVDVYAGALSAGTYAAPKLDLAVEVSAVDGVVAVPGPLLVFDPDIAHKLVLCERGGTAAGEPVGFTPDGSVLRTVRSYQSGQLYAGIPYVSSVVPTPPVIRDWREAVVHGAKATLLRLTVSTRRSTEFRARVADLQYDPTEFRVGTMPWASGELVLGGSLSAELSHNIVPCRTRVDSTLVELLTDGTGELNIVAVTPVVKYHQKIRR